MIALKSCSDGNKTGNEMKMEKRLKSTSLSVRPKVNLAPPGIKYIYKGCITEDKPLNVTLT